MAARVCRGERESRRRAVDRENARLRALERERDGQDAAARAEVGEGAGAGRGGARRLHDALGLEAGNERARIDAERAAEEFPFAEEVLQRLAGGAARDERLEGRPARGVRRLRAAAQKPGAGARGGAGEKLLRLVRGVLLARKAAPPLDEQGAPGRFSLRGGAHAGLVFKIGKMSGSRILVFFGLLLLGLGVVLGLPSSLAPAAVVIAVAAVLVLFAARSVPLAGGIPRRAGDVRARGVRAGRGCDRGRRRLHAGPGGPDRLREQGRAPRPRRRGARRGRARRIGVSRPRRRRRPR